MYSISALLQQRQKDIEFRQEVYEKIQKVENEKMNMSQNNERILSQKRALEGEIEKLLNKNKMTEKNLKEERFQNLFLFSQFLKGKVYN